MLHRQFTSRDSAELSPSDQDVSQDNKDVLIERLNDLVSLVSKSSSLEDGAVSAIHSEVDRIEKLIRESALSPKSPKMPQKSSIKTEPSTPKSSDVFWGPPTPTRSMSMRFPAMPTGSYGSFSFSSSNLREQSIAAINAIRIAKDSEELATR